MFAAYLLRGIERLPLPNWPLRDGILIGVDCRDCGLSKCGLLCFLPNPPPFMPSLYHYFLPASVFFFERVRMFFTCVLRRGATRGGTGAIACLRARCDPLIAFFAIDLSQCKYAKIAFASLEKREAADEIGAVEMMLGVIDLLPV